MFTTVAGRIITHPRPDQRHIKTVDVYELAEMLAVEFNTVEFNIEGNPFTHFLEIVQRVKLTQCTLVPDDPAAFTDVEENADPNYAVNRQQNREETLNLMKRLGLRKEELA